MTGASIAFLLGSLFLSIASVIALTPVKYIHAWGKRRRELDQRDPGPNLDKQLSETEARALRYARNNIVAALMKTYLHDRGARDHLQAAAAFQNLHPVGPEDVLTQLMFIRRDINRILREATQQKSQAWVTLTNHRSEYFHNASEVTVSRNEALLIKQFQQNLELYEVEAARALANFQRKKPLKRKSGALG